MNLQEADLFIIDRIVQPAMDPLVHWTKKPNSNFILAQCFCWIMLAYSAAMFARDLAHREWPAFVYLGLVLGVGGLLYTLRQCEKEGVRDGTERTVSRFRSWNPWGETRAGLIGMYAVFLLTDITGFGPDSPAYVRWTDWIGAILLLATLYIAACTPKPLQPVKAASLQFIRC